MLPDRKKYEQVILFFLRHFNNETMGRTKLVKLLYFLDFGFYEKYQRSVTGDLYVKYPYGPLPSEINVVLSDMKRRNMVKPRRATFHGKRQDRLDLLVEPDESVFSEDERQMLWHIGRIFMDSTAKDVEEISHNETPWLISDEGDYISYELASMRSRAFLPEALELKAIVKSMSTTQLLENSPEFMKDVKKARRSSSRSKSLTHEQVFS